jgi:hypothetical protein
MDPSLKKRTGTVLEAEIQQRLSSATLCSKFNQGAVACRNLGWLVARADCETVAHEQVSKSVQQLAQHGAKDHSPSNTQPLVMNRRLFCLATTQSQAINKTTNWTQPHLKNL